MIVTQNEAGVKPAGKPALKNTHRAMKKTCRAVVPVAACRAKATKRGWWSDYFTDYTLTNKGEQALAGSEQTRATETGRAA